MDHYRRLFTTFRWPINDLLGGCDQPSDRAWRETVRAHLQAQFGAPAGGSDLQNVTRIQGRYYFAIFVLASVTLSYQILITRFFSVMLHHHFAFAAISLAMLGLTRGAMEVYGKPARYAAERIGIELARHASWFALSSVGAMIAFLCVPLVVSAENVPLALALAIIAFVAPFTEGGVCITLLLTRLPYHGGWLYAADLLGAAVGCLGVIFILLVIDPGSATLWIGAFAA